MMKCCICGDVCDVGYEMPNGDCVCANYECCYGYCKIKGKLTIEKWDSGRQNNGAKYVVTEED